MYTFALVVQKEKQGNPFDDGLILVIIPELMIFLLPVASAFYYIGISSLLCSRKDLQ
jgi:hypothetical protein